MHTILQPHPSSPAVPNIRIVVDVERPQSGHLALRYELTGAVADLRIPPSITPTRADGLWRHTCFEAFITDKGPNYQEFNLSPSGQWAAYRFADYRDGMATAEVDTIAIAVDRRADSLRLTTTLSLPDDLPPGPLRLGLSAVIEAADGSLSYWALAHPPGAPDFHHPDCFAATLVSQGAP